MSYKSYNKTLNNLTDKAKQLFKYKVICKLNFVDYTDDITKARLSSTYYIYKNDKIIKTFKDSNFTQEDIDKLCKKYDAKLEVKLDHMTDVELDYLIEYLDKAES